MANNFTRPNDANVYASGDQVANNTAAGSVVPLSWSFPRSRGDLFISRIRIKKSTTSVTLSSFRVHLYTASPTIAGGDNAAWSTTHSGYLGSFDVVVDKAFSDAAGGMGGLQTSTGSEMVVEAIDGLVIYGLVEARAAYVPGNSEVFTVTLETKVNTNV